jgi:hypothetical protein
MRDGPEMSLAIRSSRVSSATAPNEHGRVADPAMFALDRKPAQRMKNQSRMITGIGTPSSQRAIERMAATPKFDCE